MPGFGVPQLEGDNGPGSSAGEPEPAAGFEIDVGGNGENKLSTRVSAAVAATYPSVNRSPNASSGTLIARGGSGAGGAVRGPGGRPPPGRSRSPAYIAAASASRVRLAGRPTLSRSRLPAALSSS